MDFSVKIDDETRVFDQYHNALAFIHEKVAQWNNFALGEPLHITIEKVPSATSTLGVSVAENIDVRVLFGRP